MNLTSMENLMSIHIPTTTNEKLVSENRKEELKKHLKLLRSTSYRDIKSADRAEKTISNLEQQLREMK